MARSDVVTPRLFFLSAPETSDEIPQLYLWTEGVGFEVLAQSVMDPGISADGAEVAFLGGADDLELFLWEEVSGTSQLTESDGWFGGYDRPLSIDGTGHRIVFVSDADLVPGAPGNSDRNDEIFLWAEGSPLMQLTDTAIAPFPGPGDFGDFGPVIDGDGRTVAFNAIYDLTNVGIDGGAFVWRDGLGISRLSDHPGMNVWDINRNGTHVVVTVNESLSPNAPGSGILLGIFDETEPTAGFTMTSGAESAVEGDTLRVATPPGGVATVSLSADRSSDPDGTIVAWEWRIGNFVASTESAFTIDLAPGMHSLSLLVTDNDGHQSPLATGIVVVTEDTVRAVARVPLVSNGPLAFNGTTNRLYVSEFVVDPTSDNTGSIVVIDATSNAIITRIALPGEAFVRAMTVDESRNRVYAVDTASSTVQVIDGDTEAIASTIQLDTTLSGSIDVNSATNRIYVGRRNPTDSRGSVISVIDGQTFSEIKQIAIANSFTTITDVTVNEVTGMIYALDPFQGMVSVIDGASDELITKVSIGSPVNGTGPAGVTADATRNLIYAVSNATQSIVVIDGVANSVVATIPVGKSPQRLAINSARGHLYVAGAESSDDNVMVIDTQLNAVVATTTVFGTSGFVDANPLTDWFYVSTNSGGVWVFEAVDP